MLEAAMDWLDDLHSMPFDGVPGVPGVTPRKRAALISTPADVVGCAGVPQHTPEHPARPSGVPLKPAENRHCTPGTPVTPQNDMQTIEAGLMQLRGRRPPKLRRPEMWHGVVLDAVQIYAQGWVERALSLGWSILDLYGVGKDSHDFAGLAVWLDGRKLVMLDADRAVARAYDGKHHFSRGGIGRGQDARAQPVPIWEFGL